MFSLSNLRRNILQYERLHGGSKHIELRRFHNFVHDTVMTGGYEDVRKSCMSRKPEKGFCEDFNKHPKAKQCKWHEQSKTCYPEKMRAKYNKKLMHRPQHVDTYMRNYHKRHGLKTPFGMGVDSTWGDGSGKDTRL